MNHIVLIGHTARETEIKKTMNGTTIAKTTLAVDRIGSDKADFISIVAYDKTADLIARYVRKGNRIGVEGRLLVSQKETQDGKRTYYDVVADRVEFLESKNSSEQRYQTPETYQNRPQHGSFEPQEPKQAKNEEVSIPDEYLPF